MIAGRSCGPCTVCCTELQIEDPNLHKKAGTPCPHLASAGCGIYDNRPQTCRQFLCGWRLFADLGDDWRPDLSGVLVMRKRHDEVPQDWRDAGYGVHLAITGGEESVTRPGLAEYVVRLMRQKVAVSMSAASPITLLNEHMEPNLDAARTRLPEIWRLLHAARWRFKPLMVAPLYRLQLDRQRHLVAKKLRETQP